MLTVDQAQTLAQAHVEKLASEFGRDLILLDEYTVEYPRGWAFAYNTALFEKTRKPQDGLVGNGPIFIDKETEEIFLVPTGGMRTWLEEYNKTGTPPINKGLRWVGKGDHSRPLPVSLQSLIEKN